MTDSREDRRRAAAQWLSEAAAAENQQFLSELAHYRRERSPDASATGAAQPQTQPAARVSPEALADAQTEDVDFQQHVANYDPNLFRRGRRRKVAWDKPVGPQAVTLNDSAAANAEFLRLLQNWSSQ